eukprot:c21364_g1_i1.p1 GENE.c21364_g1_i1~~c21364_g1_i1.p1  ORF type:complete len:435 (-),score=115.67 c21364_g1_i1:48-1352(-)
MSQLLTALSDRYRPQAWKNEGKYEFVGAEELNEAMKHHELLKVVALSGCGIDQLGDVEEIVARIPSVEELELSNNALHSISEILQLSARLPNLVDLNLRGNRLTESVAALGEEGSHDDNDRSKIKEIVLSDMQPPLTWDLTVAVCLRFPGLTKLASCSNGISTIHVLDSHVAALHGVEELSLDDNSLSSWADVTTLSKLPRLHTLSLNNNPIDHIDSPHDGEFSALRSLSINGTKLASWSSIDNLGLFPSLTWLSVADTPIAPTHARPLVIGRCPNITTLNHSLISFRERQEAELWLLREASRQEGDEGFTTQALRETVIRLQSKWKLILDHHAKANKSNDMSAAASLIEVEFRPVAASKCHLGSQRRNIPDSLPLTALRLVIARLFSIRPNDQVLRHLAPGATFAEEIDDSKNDIRAFLVTNGSVIVIDEKSG